MCTVYDATKLSMTVAHLWTHGCTESVLWSIHKGWANQGTLTPHHQYCALSAPVMVVTRSGGVTKM